MGIDQAIEAIGLFQGASLTGSLSEIERDIVGLGIKEVEEFCGSHGIDNSLMTSALAIKKIAGEINLVIHAAGILRSLQSILEPGELVESVSLGAGNTGRKFDLETNRRVAEYKFIDWRGGAEAIRQNGVFRDFFVLAEYETDKKKYLYLVGTEIPMKFLKGGRALTSVLSRHPGILSRIHEKYGNGIQRVSDYYDLKKDEVHVCDVSSHIGRGV